LDFCKFYKTLFNHKAIYNISSELIVRRGISRGITFVVYVVTFVYKLAWW
jgi:hypothetical protein